MRLPACLALVGVLYVAASADARSFRQTYGATVPVEDGCVWNLNQDYFVPRHCDSCRYDLFSACKHGHTNSPACRHLHPVYSCYCTPFGACRYRWRDHVYKTYCCCTPLRCYYGPWRLDKCHKHCLALRHKHTCCGGRPGSTCLQGCPGGECLSGQRLDPAWVADGGDFAFGGIYDDPGFLPNVEPLEGESLGLLPITPGTASGARAARHCPERRRCQRCQACPRRAALRRRFPRRAP